MNPNRRGCDGESGRLGARLRVGVCGAYICSAAMGLAIAIGPSAAVAGDLPGVGGPPPLVPAAPPGDFVSAWMAMASATQAAQPHWMTPLVTVTPRLEQEFRSDFFGQTQASGTHIDNFGGSKGLELIPTYETEVILGFPPYVETCPAHVNCGEPGKGNTGFGDWMPFLFKYRFAAANEQSGNYIVTGFVQMSVPTGVNTVSNDLYIVQPTLAFGKGWGDFDIQATISQQYPISTINPAVNTVSSFGDPVLANVAFQYHLFEILWPQVEVNYTYWPNGIHEGLSQVLITPGLIIGRIPLGITPRTNLIFGAGYQMAVSDHPVTNNNLVVTARVTF